MRALCYDESDWQEGIFAKILPGIFIGHLIMLIIDFEPLEGKGL